MKNQDLIQIRSYKTNLPVNPIFKNRFSPRVFDQSKLNSKDLEIIFEAVRFTPSSYNLQPWYFYVAKNGTSFFEKLSQTLMSGNQWAKKAPVLILGCFLEESSYGKNYYAQYDLGQAVATLIYQAQDLGYYTHQIAGFDHQKAKQLVEDKNHIPWVIIALGRLGDYQKADKKLVEFDSQLKQRKEKIYQIK